MSEQPKCPVDHETRAVWQSTQGQTPSAASAAPHPLPDNPDAKCPVDHTSRATWSQLGGRKQIDGSSIDTDYEPASAPEAPAPKAKAASHSSTEIPDVVQYETDVALPTDREVSSIPRTGARSNWIYPSQKQFYEAMKRKQWDPSAEDMNTVVPIHNAVNERVWHQILKWEENEGGSSCGGLQLSSFKGDSKKMTPKAMFWGLFGYTKPFDRHDWTINRCGVEVEYVIDFYQGRGRAGAPGLASFYLDVRPKLNSWEGVKLRAKKLVGL